MKNGTVYAVVKVELEVPSRPSSTNETFAQMHDIVVREAKEMLANKLQSTGIRIGKAEICRVVIQESGQS